MLRQSIQSYVEARISTVMRSLIRMRWATVTSVTPLRVQHAGEDALQAAGLGSPALGDRVLTLHDGHLLVALGHGGSSGSTASPYWISVAETGAVGDGVTDDTPALQAAIAAAAGRVVLVPPGTYSVSGLAMSTPGTRLWLAPGAILRHPTTDAGSYSVITVTAADCSITGGVIEGDLLTHTGTSGEWGHCIMVWSTAHRLRIDGVTVRYAWGDGIYVGGGPVEDVLIRDVIADSNRRQGLSIVEAVRPRVVGGVYRRTGRSGSIAPAAGIDVEPNPAGGDVTGCTITGVTLEDNTGPGLIVVSVAGRTTEATVTGCLSVGNAADGFRADLATSGTLAAAITGCTAKDNALSGAWIKAPGVSLSGFRAVGNSAHGVRLDSPTDIDGIAASANGRSGVYIGPDAGGSTVLALSTRGNGAFTDALYHDVDVYPAGVTISASVIKPGTTAPRSAWGVYVRDTATGCHVLGCRISAGAGGTIRTAADTTIS